MTRFILITLYMLVVLNLTAQLNREQVKIILDQQELLNVQIEDLDGDGDKDIIGSRSGYNGNFVVYFNLDGQGNYGPPTGFGDTTWWGNSSVELNFDLGDMDNDGDLDLVPGRFAEGDIPYYINDGNGNFSLPNVSSTFYDDGVSDNDFFRVADLDNDGQQDVVVFRTGTKELFYNRRVEGSPVFTETLVHDANLTFAVPFIEDFLLFDYDQDGDLDYALLAKDYVFGDSEIEQLYLYIYEQTCHLCFEEKLFLFLDEAPYFILGKELAASDLDGDTYPDLLIQYQKSDLDYNERDHLLLYKNLEGNGTISLEEDIIDVSSFATTDYDQDDNMDLFLAISTDQSAIFGTDEHYFWYENVGGFSFESHLISEIFSGTVLFSEDINQDEIPDLISLREGHPGILGFREGQADLSFSEYRSIDLPVEQIISIAQEDWDNDNDMDLLFFGNVHIEGVNRDGIYRATNQGDGNFSQPFRVYTTQPESEYHDFVDVNLDGTIDAIGIERMFSNDQKLIYTLQQEDGSWTEGVELDIDLPTSVVEYAVTDWDNDGDPDVLVTDFSGELHVLINEMNTTGIFIPTPLDIIPIYVSDINIKLYGDDFNQDGTADIILFQDGKLLYANSLSNEPEYAPWDTIPQPDGAQMLSFHVADFTSDGYQDILTLGRRGGSYYYALAKFQAAENSFAPFVLLNNDAYNNSYYNITADLNNDGAMDLVTGHGFRINQGNGTFFSTAYLPPPLEDRLESPLLLNAIQVDIDGDHDTELVGGFRSILAYSYDFMNRSLLSGSVRWDTTAMCQTDSLLPPLANWLVSIEGPTQNQLATTNNTGQFGSILPEVGEYKIEALPPSGYWGVCPPDTLINVLDSVSNFTIDFAAEALVDCPLVVLDMNSTSISQCFNSTVSIGYHNTGTAIAEDAVITLSFDPRLDPISSIPAWTSNTDTTLIYEFTGIDVGERGFISIVFEPDCEQLILDEELCFEATITPDELCEDMFTEWDGANLEAEVLCDNGIPSYRIVNTGEGAMDAAEIYLVSIVNDDIILYLSGEIMLEPGEAEVIPLSTGDDTWHLRISQTMGHPYPVPISLIANACDTSNDAESTNLLPNGTGNPFVANLCRTVIGPYDPNDKTAIPIGLGVDHEIERTWPLDYTIQFQNIGNDRARTVLLHDQLSELLDLSTFEPGPASHEYEWHILDDRLLIVTFPEINLPDSTSNAAASQGFFSFRIQPRSNAPFDAIIENHADIYFDFNPAIRTGTVFHTIRKPVIAAATQVGICPGDSYQGITINQDTTLEVRYEYAEYDSVHWHHISVFPPQLTEVVVSLEEADWWEGIYIEQDTTITDILADAMGCDSTIVYQLQILTNTDQIALDQAVLIQPNPAQNACWLSWSGLSSPELILVYNQLGQQVGEYYPRSGSEKYHLPTQQLASGSYNVRLHWEDKQANKVLQVVK